MSELLKAVFPKYRIIKIKNICPWQVQRRRWLFFWRDVGLSYSSGFSAASRYSELLDEDDFLNN